MRQSITGLVSFILLLIAFGLVLAASGVQSQFAQIIPKIAFCQLEVQRRRQPTSNGLGREERKGLFVPRAHLSS